MRLQLSAITLLFLVACGTRVAYLPTNSPPRALSPRSPESVEIFSTAQPQRPFVEVGIIESQQEMYSTDAPEIVFGKLREEAATRGCDGLILLGSNDAYHVQAGQYGSSGKTLKGYRGACIVWSDAAAPLTTPAEGTTTL